MPISSGAEGHAGVGVDTSIKWLPDAGEVMLHFPRRRNPSYLQRYLDTRLIARRKWISGNELKVTPEKHSIQAISIQEAACKGNRTANSSEQKIDEGEKSDCKEVQDKIRSATLVNKKNSQNTLSNSSFCAVL
ncbi:uncharacterized protein LOC144592369 [Rhinoraja longicauda]